ncbi:MAG: type secretion system sortase PorU [Bacteroidota bacterium]|jgi:flagellar hook assembly protein FlgD
MKQLLIGLVAFCSIFSDAKAQGLLKQNVDIDASQLNYGYYTIKLPLQEYAMPSIQLEHAQYVTMPVAVPDSLVHVLNDYKIVLGTERKKAFVFLQIPVYQFINGKKQQLDKITITLQENPGLKSTKKILKTTATHSVLSQGDFFKISVAKRGIYKIDYNFLKNTLGAINGPCASNAIHLFGNGGTMLSEDNSVSTPDDLTENAIKIVDGGDGQFNPGDYFIFYANGPVAWVKDSVNQQFRHVNNLYEDKSYYFVNIQALANSSRVDSVVIAANPTKSVDSYNDYWVEDADAVNVGSFGKQWWGDEMGNDGVRPTQRVFTIDADSALTPLAINLLVGARSTAGPSQLKLSINNVVNKNYYFNAVGTDELSDPIDDKYDQFAVTNTGQVKLQFDFSSPYLGAKSYIDYIEVNFRRKLFFKNNIISFRDWNSVGANQIASYSMQNANPSIMIWDVTDPLHPSQIQVQWNGASLNFKQQADQLHEFVAFNSNAFLSPQLEGKITNQDLHGLSAKDLIIVTPPAFLSAANRLAQLHQQKNNLRVVVATTTQIYNEFASGSQDIGAIRDFLKLFYQRAGADTNQMPRYLLLFGDASYDYKNRIVNNTNFVPTYVTKQSVNVINGYCSDDYFSFLDSNENIENENIANTMDIGVGRLPVKSLYEANVVVDKIEAYMSAASFGPWRLSTTVVADNEDGAGPHLQDGEIMASSIANKSNIYYENKVYLDNLPFVSSPGGIRCPDANKTINDQVFKGTLLINYNGHGNIERLAHENILSSADYLSWNNEYKMPFMITATCEFSRFDNPAYVSAGEQLVLREKAGAIALVTTTQVVYQSSNRIMNSQYLMAQFSHSNTNWTTFGDAFRRGKNQTYVSPGSFDLANFRKFALLGDPALLPAFPKELVSTDSIVDMNTQKRIDSLKALGHYKIEGSVYNANNQVLSNFNGTATVLILDKPRKIQLVTKETNANRTYYSQNSIIYKGQASVQNGHFAIEFILPKDLDIAPGKTRILYYAQSANEDAAGCDTNFVLGNFSDTPIVDDDKPIVRPFMNDSLFRNGAITNPNSVLYVKLSDASGINVSGNSVGHDCIAILDEDEQHPFVLNDYYETETGTYKKGIIKFPMKNLTLGMHSIKVKAWDINNNSGVGSVEFKVVDGNETELGNVFNYPNPFNDVTTFSFEHNHPNENLEVQIDILSTSGQLIHQIKENIQATGSRTATITWDTKSSFGVSVASGMYVYRIGISTVNGQSAAAYQKLIIVR